MSYFTHRFETRIVKHMVGTMAYTVVFLDPAIADEAPFTAYARLRIEADVAGVPVKGAWQRVRGRWYLMLPRAELKSAGLRIGSPVEVAFRVIAQDDVDVPEELADLLAANARVRGAWVALTPGKQRGFAHMVASAKRPETRAARVRQVEQVLYGEAPLPWDPKGRRLAGGR